MAMKAKNILAMVRSNWPPILIVPVIVSLWNGCASPQLPDSSQSALRQALTFHASFDGGADADFALGDRKIYWAPSMRRPRVGKPGLPENGSVTLASGEGRFGDALRFHKKVPEMVFFQAGQNLAYRQNDWSGTVSLWLKLNPDEDLEPGYCDPIQITPREWNDAAFFVDFSKDERPRHFRLGAFADLRTWNPTNRRFETIPANERPMVTVTRPPFRRDRWTHVVFTYSHFNTGKDDGTARLYLNGQFQGGLTERQQTFTWEVGKSLMMLGLSYVGLYDELAVFNRALTDQEVQTLYRLKGGVRSLGI